MITITNSRGFRLKFDNEWTISVQLGYENYCANYNKGDYNTTPESSPNAEIAVFNPDGDMIELLNDTVCGYVPTEAVTNAIMLVRTGLIDELRYMLGNKL